MFCAYREGLKNFSRKTADTSPVFNKLNGLDSVSCGNGDSLRPVDDKRKSTFCEQGRMSN